MSSWGRCRTTGVRLTSLAGRLQFWWPNSIVGGEQFFAGILLARTVRILLFLQFSEKNRTAADFCCCPTTAFRWKTVLTLGAPAGQKNRIPSENCCFKQQSTAVILLSMVYRMAAESCTALAEWRLMFFAQVWLTLPPRCLRDLECRDLAFISATRMQREHH